MRRTSHLLFVLTLAAIAVPLIPFLLFGTRLDRIVGQWLDPLPSVPVMAGLEVAVLAADLLLPVPSSVVATLGGAHLGIALGTCCAWLGMTAGAAAGWWLGRVAGGQALSRLRPEERIFLEQQERRFGPLFIGIDLVPAAPCCRNVVSRATTLAIVTVGFIVATYFLSEADHR